MTSDTAENTEKSKHTTYCNYCPGFCCYKLPGSTLYITANDINRMARFFNISDGEVRKRYIDGKNTFKTRNDGSCIFLQDGKLRKRCGIHQARPQQCRDFPYNSSCPYLEREDLLQSIYPKVASSLKKIGIV